MMKTGCIDLFRSLKELAFPRLCAGCGKTLALGEHFVCPQCIIGLSRVKPRDWTNNDRICKWYEHPEVKRVAALVRYQRETVEARIIHRLKYGRHWQLGIWMGELAAAELQESGLFEGIDVIIPIPLSRQRRFHRGFNQAEMIARGMSQAAKLPVRTDVLQRTKNNESQTHFSTEERLHRAHNLFRLRSTEGLSGKHIMLVDDVMTTGVTMLGAILTLKAIPNIRITAFSWAWTRGKSQHT